MGIDTTRNLINPSIEEWWWVIPTINFLQKTIRLNSGRDVTPAKHQDTSPSQIAEAYANPRGGNATLTFIVPTISLLSCIPAALAWSHTPSEVGGYNDGNFYQLLCSSTMQLLGTVTLIWPVVLATSYWPLSDLDMDSCGGKRYLYGGFCAFVFNCANCMEWGLFILWDSCPSFGIIATCSKPLRLTLNSHNCHSR